MIADNTVLPSLDRHALGIPIKAECLILLRRRSSHRDIAFVHQRGIPQSLLKRYTGGLYEADPHLKAIQDLNDTPLQCATLHGNVPQDGDSNVYWRELTRCGVTMTAAQALRITANTHLLSGFLSATTCEKSELRKLSGVTDRWLDQCAERLIEQLFDESCVFTSGSSAPKRQSLSQLTARETDIAGCVLKGLSNKQIAEHCQISVYTVENHLRSIYKKLSVQSRTALLATFRDKP